MSTTTVETILQFLISQFAVPPIPLLKMKRVTGVRASIVHSVSIKFTETQKAVMTARMPAMLSSMATPQKSTLLMLAERLLCAIR